MEDCKTYNRLMRLWLNKIQPRKYLTFEFSSL